MKYFAFLLFLSFIGFTNDFSLTSPAVSAEAASNSDTTEASDDDEFEDEEENIINDEDLDPLEPMNRGLFALHRLIDTFVLEPTAVAYKTIIPDVIQDRFSAFMKNLKEPLNFANNLLRLDIEKAGLSVIRFILNTTIGVLGLVDVASELGVETAETSFAETLASWGADTGPYLVVPVFGPSSFRGVTGLGVDSLADPWYHISGNTKRKHNKHKQQRNLYTVLKIIDGVSKRADLLEATQELERTSFDLYSSYRSIYFQQQRKVDERIAQRKKEMDITESF